MRMNLELSIAQKLTPAVRQELKHSLALQFSQKIELLRVKSGDAPENLLPHVIEDLLDSIDNKNLREGIAGLLSDEQLRKSFIERCGFLASLKQERIEDFVLQYIFRKNHGGFRVLRGEKDESGELSKEGSSEEVLNVVESTFIDAFKQPESLKKEVLLIESSLKNTAWIKTEDGRGAQERLRDIEKAFAIVDSSKLTFEVIIDGVRFALLKKGKDNNEPILGNFLRDAAILGRLDPIISERLQKRFVTSARNVRENDSPDRFKNAFLNTIGEYTLMSMGVISPDIFELQRSAVEKEDRQELEDIFKDLGLDLRKVKQDYNLRGEGSIFWNRWKTLDKRPSVINDNLIREFITETVRSDAEKLLDAAKYEQFISRVKEINQTSGPDSRDIDLRELLLETLSGQEFEAAFLDLLKNKWHQKLDIFYHHDHEELAHTEQEFSAVA